MVVLKNLLHLTGVQKIFPRSILHLYRECICSMFVIEWIKLICQSSYHPIDYHSAHAIRNQTIFAVNGKLFLNHHKICQSFLYPNKLIWYNGSEFRKVSLSAWQKASFSSSVQGVVKIMILVTTKMEFLLSPIHIRTIG